MIAGRASLTAALVALARGERPPAQLLPEPLASGVRLFERAGLFKAAFSPFAHLGSLGFVDHIELRTAAIDAAITAAAQAGIEQVVLLGAGLDARAWSMPALAGATVFEVDHPTTQVAKRAWLGASAPMARAVRFVPVDFEREQFPPALDAAAFDRHARTLWIWEGVVMYLTDEAVRSTLRDIARCSVPGSVLIANYHTPHSRAVEAEHRVRRMLLSVWREPQIGQRTPETMHEELRRAGFDLVSDSEPPQWAQRLGAKAPEGQAARVMRIFVAKRSATAS